MEDNDYVIIIIKYFKKLTDHKNKTIYDLKIIKNIQILENDITQLKNFLYIIQNIIFSSNYYVSDYIKNTWNSYFHICENRYRNIKVNNYEELFTFFLLIIHNIPIILSYHDNSIAGCNCLMFDNNIISSKYNEYELVEKKEQLEITRLYDWAYNVECNKNTRCFCKFYF